MIPAIRNGILAKHAMARPFSTSLASRAAKEGLVLGIFDTHTLYGSPEISPALLDKIKREASAANNKGREGSVQLMSSDDPTTRIALVGLGNEDSITTRKSEKVRIAVAAAIKKLDTESIKVGPMPCQHAAGEGASLATYRFARFKTQGDAVDKPAARVETLSGTRCARDAALDWESGRVYGAAQNFARDLMNTPPNYMTPTVFGEAVRNALAAIPNVTVNVHDKAWIERERMGGVLAVAKGSDEAPKFLEIEYRGAGSDAPPLAFVGKGITFDSGGMSLKLGKNMDLMKGDMGGGATVVAALQGIARLALPVNVVCTVPLCENMINGHALKVSDVYTARSGLTVEVMNTDAEGRLVLADALDYTIKTHRPHTVVDVATLTGAMVAALGELYTGVFTNCDALWAEIDAASRATDEPAWRMPLHDRWDAMLKSHIADLNNIGSKAEAGACTAAAFLRHFVHGPRGGPSAIESDQNNDGLTPRWAHLDIAGPMESSTNEGYASLGMSGRPTRMLIELARQAAKK